MGAWEIAKLSDVCEIQRGGSPRPIESFITEAEDGINWIKIGDVAEGAKYITSTKEKIKPGGAQRSRAVQEGDFLLSNSMSFGRPYILKTSGCIHDGWLVLRYDKSKLTEDYLYHVLGSEFVFAQFLKFAVGAVVKNLNSEVVRQVSIPLPSLPEQRRIAAILDQADALRAKRREALAELDWLTQSIFIEMFGDPVTNPKGWPVCTLEQFFQFQTGKLDSNAAIPDGAYPFFTCAKEEYRIDSYAFDCEALLLAGNNANADYSVKHYNGKFNAYQRTYVITLKNPQHSYRYSAFFLESHLAVLKRVSKGSSTKYLTLGLLNNIRIPVPPPKLQHEFGERIEALNQARASYMKSQDEMNYLFTSLQHRAFRGEL